MNLISVKLLPLIVQKTDFIDSNSLLYFWVEIHPGMPEWIIRSCTGMLGTVVPRHVTRFKTDPVPLPYNECLILVKYLSKPKHMPYIFRSIIRMPVWKKTNAGNRKKPYETNSDKFFTASYVFIPFINFLKFIICKNLNVRKHMKT